MDAANVVRAARKAAGITQAELAARAGTTQSAISRVERGHLSPAYDTLERLVAVCGMSLDVRLAPDSAQLPSFEANLQLTPGERLNQLVRTVQFIEVGRKAMNHRVG